MSISKLNISPTPSNTATITPSLTPTSTVCPGLTPTATGTPAITPTPSITASPTQTLTPSPSSTIETTPSPTASITATPTQTETPNVSPTSTIGTTPTPTPTIVEYCNYPSIDTQASLDIEITDVEVSGVSVSYISGTNFVIEPSEPTGYFGSNISGNSVNVRVWYNSSITGQNIVIVDCNETAYCCDTNVGTNIYCDFTVDLFCGCSWTITASDGSCV